MRAAEAALIEGGESAESLMERAGQGAADWVWRLSGGRSVTVLCGPGNNGGDGYVIARELEARGSAVSVVAPLDPATDAARKARAAWGGRPVATAKGDVLVDCLLGTGLSRPLSDEHARLMEELAAAHEQRIAVDLPSGVDSDTGALLNDGLPQYDVTVALGAWKRAHWLMPASERMGERRLVEIGVGDAGSGVALATPPSLSPPAMDAHKYSRGLLLVVGGKMVGAALLAARAAQHAGAGYVKLLSEHSHPALPADLVHDDGDPAEALADERVRAVLIGPGLGRGDAARRALEAVLQRGVPCVLDADALVLLTPAMLPSDCSHILVTPHAGELAKLCEAFAITDGPKLELARELAQVTGMTVLAKGPDNVLASPEHALLFPPAPRWLSTAGTGDVLAGLAASRMATGDTPMAAGGAAVVLHSEAARQLGPVFSAGELVGAVRAAYARFL
ncbi:sugar kinase [Aurantiacibacter luteus]|uniref:Bifunctional NAD(P)H-hydrate repair enzyme n=2 Tax=Aurantiacibacter luteus TaxID=1581420 RepID=A0A0G9MZ86_9SPHN|nr:sugar kinase [Aurantiacibacter luteus]